MNEDLLNPNMHNLKDVSQPTRQLALLNPIILHEHMSIFKSDKANCLNDYFASILTVNDDMNTHNYLPLSRLALSQIHCNEHEIETIIEVLNPYKASGDDGISHKMLKGVS